MPSPSLATELRRLAGYFRYEREPNIARRPTSPACRTSRSWRSRPGAAAPSGPAITSPRRRAPARRRRRSRQDPRSHRPRAAGPRRGGLARADLPLHGLRGLRLDVRRRPSQRQGEHRPPLPLRRRPIRRSTARPTPSRKPESCRSGARSSAQFRPREAPGHCATLGSRSQSRRHQAPSSRRGNASPPVAPRKPR